MFCVALLYKKGLRFYSRKLRSNMTDCERLLWSKISRRQILDVQFYRQRPIGHFIVDFCSNHPLMAIELDGGQHNEPEQVEKDQHRERYLKASGLYVLRFSNMDILESCDGVLEEIASTIEKLKAKHPPLASLPAPYQRGN